MGTATKKKVKAKVKKSKVYTLAEVGERLGFSGRSIRDFVKVGLIHAFPNPTWMAVTEAELKRVMREGLDTSDVTAKVVAMRRAAAKKQPTRRNAGAAAKKRATRNTAAAAKKGAKKQVKRGVTATRKATKRKTR